LSKIPFYEKMFFWQKDYSPLKQSKQIGSFIHDYTLIYYKYCYEMWFQMTCKISTIFEN
jgi:hypothetical protein